MFCLFKTLKLYPQDSETWMIVDWYLSLLLLSLSAKVSDLYFFSLPAPHIVLLLTIVSDQCSGQLCNIRCLKMNLPNSIWYIPMFLDIYWALSICQVLCEALQVYCLIITTTLWDRYCFANEDIKPQGNWTTCPRYSASKCQDQDLNTDSLYSEPYTFFFFFKA